MGHPRCAVPSCRESLANNRHRFCPVHFENHHICAVRSCLEPVLPPGKMCANPQHRQMEKLNKARGEASFQLASRMQRNRVSHSTDSMLSEVPEQEESDLDTTLVSELEENVTWFDVYGNGAENVEMYHEHKDGCIGEEDGAENSEEDIEMDEQRSSADIEMDGELALCVRNHPDPRTDWFEIGTVIEDSTVGTVKRTCKTDLARSRTHSEQTLMFPCGIMIAHASFYNAEAVSNVLVCLYCITQCNFLFSAVFCRCLLSKSCLPLVRGSQTISSTTAAALRSSNHKVTPGLQILACASILGTSKPNTRRPTSTAESIATLKTILNF